jgi:hypothetical protein
MLHLVRGIPVTAGMGILCILFYSYLLIKHFYFRGKDLIVYRLIGIKLEVIVSMYIDYIEKVFQLISEVKL